MCNNQIHQLALVHPKSELDGITVEPYAIIEEGVVLGRGCTVKAGAHIKKGVVAGVNNTFYEKSIIGAEPLIHLFNVSINSGVRIGNGNIFREMSNVGRAGFENQNTIIGDENYCMPYSHISHDNKVGNHNTLVNHSNLGGHVEIENHIFISASVNVHQFCKIGSYCIVGILTKVAQNIPPYISCSPTYGVAGSYRGLNIIGLRRAAIPPEERKIIKECYQIIYHQYSAISKGLKTIEQKGLHKTKHGKAIYDFVKASNQPISKTNRGLINKTMPLSAPFIPIRE